MTSNLDLSLPSHFPADLRCFDDKSSDIAAFPLYTLMELPQNKLDALLKFLNEGNRESMDYDPEGDELVRTPPEYNFAGKSLKDVLHAHTILMHKNIIPNHCVRLPGSCIADLSWYPYAFIVVTSTE